MSDASSSTDHPAGRQARARLVAYRRYAEIVAEQEKALIAGDVGRYDALASVTHEIQDRVGLAPMADPTEDPDAANTSFVDEIADILKATLATHERIQSRLWGVHQGAAADRRRSCVDGHHTPGYDGAEVPEAGSSLDLRF